MTLVMPKPTKDKKSGIYYLRVRVPADLVGPAGRFEETKSLRTRDPAEAKERFAQEYAALQRRWSRMRAEPSSIPLRQIVGLSARVYHRLMDSLHDEPGEPGIWQQVLRIGGEAEAASNGLERWYGSTVDELLDEEGIAIDTNSRARLLLEVHKSWKQAAEQQLKRSSGDFSPDPDANRFPAAAAKPSANAGTRSTTLTDIFDRWEKDHLSNGKSPRTVTDFAQKKDSLAKYLGHEDIAKISPRDISSWCDFLRDEKGLAPKTISMKYLAAIRAIFRLARSKFLVPSDPTEGVAVKVPKAVVTRSKGFTDEEARRILTCSNQVLEAPSRATLHNRLACRWVPWICAYTGARAGEIAQLRKEDFSVADEIPQILITPEAGTVKAGKFRTVPLHPHLESLGLFDFIKASPSGYLFLEGAKSPEVAVKKAGNARDKVSKWVREVVGITDPRIQPNHAWRHRFSTQARNAGVGREYRTALQGHADGSAAEGYGEYSAQSLYREICKIPWITLY